MKRYLPLVSGIALVAACGGIALAQKNPAARPAPAPATASPKPGESNIRIRNSPAGTALYDNKRGISRITKDVVVTEEGEDFILYCDEITYNERTNEAIAKGNLRLQSRNSTLTGSQMRADFDTRTIVIIGNVTMHSFGKKDGVRAGTSLPSKRKPSVMTCDRISYNYRNRQAQVTGNIRMKQGTNTGTCDLIIFDEDRNVAELQGNVVFTNSDTKRTIRARNATVWIDEDMVQTTSRTTVITPRDRPDRPVPPKADIKPAPTLSDEDLREFGRVLPPATPSSTAAPESGPGRSPNGEEGDAEPGKAPAVENDKR